MKPLVQWVCSRMVRRSVLNMEKPLERGSLSNRTQMCSKDALLDERSRTPQDHALCVTPST